MFECDDQDSCLLCSYLNAGQNKIAKPGLAEIIRCLCTKVVFLQIIGDCAVAWTSSIEFVACMSSENCCA